MLTFSYYIRAGTSATANLLPVTAPVDPLLTLATLILPRLAQATVSRRAIIRWHSSHSSLKKLTSQSPVVAPEAACTSQVRVENYRILNPHFGHFQTSTVTIRLNQSLKSEKRSDWKSQNTANKNLYMVAYLVTLNLVAEFSALNRDNPLNRFITVIHVK